MNPFEKIIQDLKKKPSVSPPLLKKGQPTEEAEARQAAIEELFEDAIIPLNSEEHRASFRSVVTKIGKRFWRGIQLLTGEDARRFMKKGKE